METTKTFDEIKNIIKNLSNTVKPVGHRRHELRHSNGLVSTYHEDIYGEPIPTISQSIWKNNSLSLTEKQELNEALASKLSK